MTVPHGSHAPSAEASPRAGITDPDAELSRHWPDGAILLVIGNVIGSGIFLTTGVMASGCRRRRSCSWHGPPAG